MNTSLFELFKIGIGPSSSHTVGPMRAALRFLRELGPDERAHTAAITVDLYGSLALTGIGHATDRAVLMGLLGESPDTVDLDTIDARLAQLRREMRLELDGAPAPVRFDAATDLRFHRDQMYPGGNREPTHPNGLRLTALAQDGSTVYEQVYYSVGGGFVVSAEELATGSHGPHRDVPFPFASAEDLLRMGHDRGLTIAEMVMANELALLSDASITRRIDRIFLQEDALHDALSCALQDDARVAPLPHDPVAPAAKGRMQIEAAILTLWQTMQHSIRRGMVTQGVLPGGLNVRRRAPGLAARMERLRAAGATPDPLAPLDAVTMAAMAVNEENAAGGRVVTAPTNGAAGVVPAVAYYFAEHAGAHLSPEERTQALLRYFLTAAAIGILYKENASISGAEVGCQGEVGVACSMAAGGLVAALGGDNAACEHAAEIGMEHNLGMTCDPIGGLVQIPCIERNGVGAIKAVSAARLAMNDTGTHKISLDQVIETMYRTGMDMQSRYKETSLGGLALNIIEC